VQDAVHKKDDAILKAVTGLEGGCVASGSTCGIATGGALGLALAHDHHLENGGIIAESAVMEIVGDYLVWFQNSFGTTQCGEKNKIDFHKVTGQLRYFLSVIKMTRCIAQAGSAINYLSQKTADKLPINREAGQSGENSFSSVHCARNVLEIVRKKTGVGNKQLETISIVLDGGVGLKGKLCGAAAGAILALNLVTGFNLRQMNYSTNFKKFLYGHISLLRKNPGKSIDTFFIGKQMINKFKEKFGSIECRKISGKHFSTLNGFKEHIEASDKCKNLIDFSGDIASRAILNTRIIL
jgi:C_GCAxxG_C_C family probable redox protein